MLSPKKMTLLFIPAILVVSLALFVQIIKYKPLFPKIEEKEKTSQFIIPLYPEDPIIGDKKAPITIVSFEDFSCGSCIQQIVTLDNLQKKYPNKFKIIWKGLPLTEFPYSSLEIEKHSYCANQQKKFEDFKQYAISNSDNLSADILKNISKEIKLDESKLNKCLNSEEVLAFIEKNKQIAQILNVQSLPTFFINNEQITNPTTEYEWEDVLGLIE
ncbi:MAG: thioredoxin domain-containing protein [Candidatus Magasanikbacteria bacterium]